MARCITALEPQKRSRDRVNVYLDGQFAFGLASYVAMELRVGDCLSDAEIARLTAEDEVAHAHNRALDYLSYRPRSEAELRKYLSDKGFQDGVVEEVVARLNRVGLVDDITFARFWRDSRARFRPRGRRVLGYELSQKGVDSATIEEALDDYDEAAALRSAAEEQARRLQHLPADQFRRRLIGRLVRRGFTYELTRDTPSTLDFPQLNDETSEAD